MKVGELRALLVGVPDDMEVVAHANFEGEYVRIGCKNTEVLKAETNHSKTRFWVKCEDGVMINNFHSIVDVFFLDNFEN